MMSSAITEKSADTRRIKTDLDSHLLSDLLRISRHLDIEAEYNTTHERTGMRISDRQWSQGHQLRLFVGCLTTA